MVNLAAPRGTIIHQTETRQRKININVGGEKHSPYVSTLRNFPESPLAWIIQEENRAVLDYDPEEDMYFFDRHPGIFTEILNYYQTGKLHCPRDVCGPMFQEELIFWGIDETQMEACCWPNYTAHREIQENLKMLHIARQKVDECKNQPYDEEYDCSQTSSKINSGQAKWHRYQRKIWEALDEPYSSKVAKAFAYISLGFIVLSIITYSMISVDEINFKQTTCQQNNGTSSESTCKGRSYGADILRGFEILFAVWFTLEIALRVIFCPDKIDFIKTLSNWVDLFAVIPVYMLLLHNETSTVLMMLNMIRYLRVFRLFKLLYDLHILGKTLQASVHQLLILLAILCVPTIIFSSFVYYAELYAGTTESKDDFSDILKGMWWSVITMTTVGYGRAVPASMTGKLFGGMASVIGILIVSMTTSVIGCNFEQYYSVAITQLRIPAKKSTAIKEILGKNTLLSQLHQHAKGVKSQSIKSDDSKDSGYGRSPIPPPTDSDRTSSPTEVKGQRCERNLIIAMDKDGKPVITDTTSL